MNTLLTDCKKGQEGEMSAPRRVLFVCTGNTCRSPMAAALLNDMMRAREVCSMLPPEEKGSVSVVASSAGLYAMEGDPISPEAVSALRRAGIPPLPSNDYTAHRATTVTAAQMEAADEVIAISAGHAVELMMRFPDCASKIATLATDISDPFGGSESVYTACLAQLTYCIRRRFFGLEAE